MAILTISREFGSGGREIGQAVAALLNYEYIDKQNILYDLKSAGDEWEKWEETLMSIAPLYGKNMTGLSGGFLLCFSVAYLIMRSEERQ